MTSTAPGAEVDARGTECLIVPVEYSSLRQSDPLMKRYTYFIYKSSYYSYVFMLYFTISGGASPPAPA